MIDVSIIIVNYKTSQLICDAIDSIIARTYGITFEILVVDNASGDDSEQIIKQKHENIIKFITLPQNIGFGKANNVGIEQANGRNILLLNPDTVLINNAIEILSKYLDENPNVGVCGGNLYDENINSSHSYRRIMPGILEEINSLLLGTFTRLVFGRNRLFNHTKKPIDVAFIVGADMMIKAEVLKKTGAFDKDFFMYYEETELTHRIKKAGYRIMSVPEAKIIHLESKSFNFHEDKMRMSLEGREIYFKKMHAPINKWLADKIFYLVIYSRLIIFSFWNREKREQWSATMKIFRKIRNN